MSARFIWIGIIVSAGIIMTGDRIPKATQDELRKTMGMTDEQADTVLQLISLAENGEPEWWKHYNYIERLGDGRGYTVTIFGACSGTGDLLLIFDELAKLCPGHRLLKYHAALRRCKGENVSGVEGLLKDIPRLGDDQDWRRAVWKVYMDMYWRFAADFAAKRGECASRPGPRLDTPLAKGFFVDTAINHGADMSSFRKVVQRMDTPEAAEPKQWLQDFMRSRQKMLKSGFEHLDTSKTGDRCLLWSAVLAAGNDSLRRPIAAHNGYWGKGLVIA